MRDILPTIDLWIGAGEPFAIAIVTATWGSSPRPVGSALAVSRSGELVGSVSGGCVEASVSEAALRVIESGQPVRLVFEAVPPEEVWKVGLTCGGQVEVWVFPGWSPGPNPWAEAAANVRNRVATTLELPHPEGGPAFTWVFNPPDRLIVIGAVHIAIPLVAMARELGFETLVIEPRQAIADGTRFSSPPDQLLGEWPTEALAAIGVDAATCVVTLSHDPKLDEPALAYALRSSAAYIGALGSRTSHAQRCDRLRSAGFNDEDIARIRGPVGLPIGAKTPAEIALSILAEIVQVRRGV